MLEKYSKILSNAPGGMSFRTGSGEIQSLKELRAELFIGGSRFFGQFVSATENHFANWIENSIGDKELASSLKITKDFASFTKVLDDRINYLELWIKHNKDKENLSSFLLENSTYALSFEPTHHGFETAENFSLHGAADILAKSIASEDSLDREIRMLKTINDRYGSPARSTPTFFSTLNPFKRK